MASRAEKGWMSMTAALTGLGLTASLLIQNIVAWGLFNEHCARSFGAIIAVHSQIGNIRPLDPLECGA